MANAEEERPSWGRHLEFIFTCIGFAVGLGNVWRFPHLVYTNGGGAFLIPYIISLVFLGIPLFCLEILFGQFANLGPITIWEINPLFKGLGYTMVTLAAVISVYYNIVVATAIYFLFASMQSTLPWTTCGNDWNTCACRTPSMNVTLEDPTMWLSENGLDCTYVNTTVAGQKSSSEEFYYNKVLELTSGIDEPGSVKWDLTLCNLLAWTIICICLIKGVKTMGKAVYFFALFPYVLLTILIIRGLTLDGASKGIDFYLTADTSKLSDSKVWKDAASQIFFSLSCCTGSLTAMSSYNQFKSNFFRDGLIIPVINCCTSFFAGFAIFSVLGFMSENSGKPVGSVTTSGPGLIFVAYPQGLGEMPLPQFWSILFFLMMLCLGFGTQFPSVETVMTALQDEFPILRRKTNSLVFRISICIIGFLLGLPMTTQGGYYVTDLCDIFVGFPLLFVGFFECVAIVWVYGVPRLFEDILLMVGGSDITRKIFYCYYSWNFALATPLLILAIIIFDCVKYEPITSPEYPEWAEGLGWGLVALIMFWLPLWFVVGFFWKGGAQLCWKLNQPTIKWGPVLPENRTLPRYQLLLNQNTKMREDDVDTYEYDLGNANIDIDTETPTKQASANTSNNGVFNEGFEVEHESPYHPPQYDDCLQDKNDSPVEITAL